MTTIYMLTISCQQKKQFISQKQLEMIILYLKFHINTLKIYKDCYETSGLYNQLHYHAIVSSSKYFKFIDYNSYKTEGISFRIQWKKIYNYRGAASYLQKDLHFQSQDQILIKNYYKHHYFNQDTQRFSAITV